jgi:hypothetical protein
MDTFLTNRHSLDEARPRESYTHAEDKPTPESSTSLLSPRDRDTSSAPPLVEGLESSLAGQASPASLGRNDEIHLTYLKRDDEINSDRNDGFTATASSESELETPSSNAIITVGRHAG